MDNNTYEKYFKYLKTRKRLKKFLYSLIVYPQLAKHLSGKIIDIGCGIGDFLSYRPDATGVDINPFNVQYCKDLGLNATQITGSKYPFKDHSFHGAIMDNVLEHIEDPDPIISEIRRILQPGGTLIIGVPGICGYGADPDHKIFYDEQSLAALLAKHDFSVKTFIFSPFFVRSNLLNKKLRQYCVYGVFRLK